MRCVILGDSLTAVEDGAPSYCAELARLLRADPRLTAVTLECSGVGGDTIVNITRRIADVVFPSPPDWLIVFAGVNDCRFQLASTGFPRPSRIWQRRYFHRKKFLRQVSTVARFRDALRTLVDVARHRCAASIALCTPAMNGESAFSREAELLDQYADAVRMVASERGCDLIDIRRSCSSAIAESRQLSPGCVGRLRARWHVYRHEYERAALALEYRLTYDGVHLGTAGAQIVAEAIRDWLLECVTHPGSIDASTARAARSPLQIAP